MNAKKKNKQTQDPSSKTKAISAQDISKKDRSPLTFDTIQVRLQDLKLKQKELEKEIQTPDS